MTGVKSFEMLQMRLNRHFCVWPSVLVLSPPALYDKGATSASSASPIISSRHGGGGSLEGSLRAQ